MTTLILTACSTKQNETENSINASSEEASQTNETNSNSETKKS